MANKYTTYGARPGSNSYKILHHLRQNSEKSFGAGELAKLFGFSDSAAWSALSAGFLAGCYTREKRGPLSFYRFEKMPDLSISTGRAVLNKKQTKYAEMLYTRRIKNEEAAAIKKSNQAKEGIIIPKDLQIQEAKMPQNFGNRYHVDPASVPVFRYGSQA